MISTGMTPSPGRASARASINRKFAASAASTISAKSKMSGDSLPIGRNGMFSGYASLFGKADLGKDLIRPGAFAQSLREKGAAGIRMLFQHDPASPIGTWQEIYEDRHGLYVRGTLVGATKSGAEILSLLKAGALDGLSIGFHTRQSWTNRKTGLRTITRADLWEVSIVTFPMQPHARVTHVSSVPAH